MSISVPVGGVEKTVHASVSVKGNVYAEAKAGSRISVETMVGLRGEKGDKGDPFTYEDFTPEQLESLRGPQGERGEAGPAGKDSTVPGPQGEPGRDGKDGRDGLDSTVPGPKGDPGQKGEPFRYSDFTTEQLEALRGPRGERGEVGPASMVPGPQGEQGPKGEPFRYADFTAEQLESLRGPQGVQGEQGQRGADGFSGVYVGASDTTPTDSSNVWIVTDGDSNVPGYIDAEYAVTVGSGGDYQTISEAMKALEPMSHSARATVTLASGFTMSEQVVFDGVDMSWVSIESEDAVVPIDGTSFERTIYIPEHGQYSSVTIGAAFTATNGAQSPSINALFEFIGETGRYKTGIAAHNNATVTVGKGGGVRNGQNNLYLIGAAHGYAFSGVFDNAYGNCVNVFRTSVLAAGGMSASNSGQIGCYVDSNSTAELSGSSFNNCTDGGLRVETGCVVTVTDVDVSGNANGYGLEVANGGRVGGRNLNADGCKDGISVKSGGIASIVSSSAKNCSQYALNVNRATAYASGCYLSNATKNGVIANGANVTLQGSDCRKTADVDSQEDIALYDGSSVNVSADTLGGTNIAAGLHCANGIVVGRNFGWELIKSMTIASETTATTQINRDDNNQPFYLIAAHVIVKAAPKSATATATETEIVFRRSGNGISAVVVPESVAGSYRYYSADCYLNNGMWVAEAVSGQAASAYTAGPVIRGQRPTPSFANDYNCIDRIDLGKIVTAGTTVSVYGIRGALS